ncbi:flavodoxin [Clostridium sp. WILCCON 0269]|uniref:Flavodoxin n=1 Tax=Candidatus Clostridium eludens TaxID=3381663 RepID=A0ABW8SI31_9CLOT
MPKSLIAFFSYSGNTEVIANTIKENVGGELFKIETIESYPTNYNGVVDKARQEQNAHYRPELAAKVTDMDSYDIIYIGYPNWCSTIPMAVFTFLESYDFSGKTIIPFCTHGGGGMGRSASDIKKLCPNSNVLEGVAISGSSVNKAGKDVSAWLSEIGVI